MSWAGVTLLHPWAAVLGVLAIGLPIAIHLLTRPRPLRVQLSTVRFVRQALEQKKSRNRLRDILVLLLRALAVLLLAWAFSRPMVGAKPLVDPAAPGTVLRVIVLDQSLSMAAVSDATTAFDRARAAASKYLSYQPGLRGDVILAAARPKPVFDTVSSNIGALRDALQAATPQPQRVDAQEALNRAGRILASTPPGNGSRLELVIISNFQRTNWGGVDFSPIPKDAMIQFESVAPAHPPDNLAILRVGAKGRMERGRDVQLEAQIGNFSETPRDVQVSVDLGQVTYHLQGLCPPRVNTTLSATLTLPATAGWLCGEAKILGAHDALAADDARPLALQVRALPTYVLITRESAKPHPSSSHFLERALVPEKPQAGQAAEKVIRLDPANLDRDVVGSSSLLVLDHPGALSDETIQFLGTLVRRGHGMFYVAADPVDAENLARLARMAGEDLKMPVEFVPPPAAQPRHDLFLRDWKRDQAPFDQLGDLMPAVAGELRFDRGLGSHPLESGLADDVLASYSDGSAALVVTPCGAGTIAVLNADLTASNLPASPLFVPLVEELCGRLLAVHDSADAVLCGESMAQYLPAECGTSQGLKTTGPSTERDAAGAGTLSDESSGVLWHADAMGGPGVYEVKRGDQTVFAMASAAPASQSDLNTIDPSTLTTRLAAGRRVGYEAASDAPPKDDVWTWLLVGCAICLVSEVGVLKLFRT